MVKAAFLTMSDQFLRNHSGLLGFGKGGGNTLVGYQFGDQAAQQRNALVFVPTKLSAGYPVRSHS
jgi:hypothetical protein